MKKSDSIENVSQPAKVPQIENAAQLEGVLSAEEIAKLANEETAAGLEHWIAQKQAKGQLNGPINNK